MDAGLRSPAGQLRVVIDARLASGLSGGVEPVIIGLAGGISRLSGGEETYHFLVHEGEDDWLRPHVSGAADFLRLPRRFAPTGLMARTRRTGAAAVPRLASAWRWTRSRYGDRGPVPSDGTIERFGADVMHFTFQRGFLTGIPSIYHPHDLQHLHLPQFFTANERRRRERWYRALCAQAAMVAVASTWTKHDVELQYGLPPDKVEVVPLAPPTMEYAEPGSEQIEEMATRLGVPARYALYPAQTWPHKNHIGLLEALADLRGQGLIVPLVSTGTRTDYFGKIAARADELGIADQVRWLGFVSPMDLQCLYARARIVVIPSRFEAASAPLWEAFRAGIPAACSNVTSLPDQAGDAALVFDPDDRAGMVDAIRRIWVDDGTRADLVEKGMSRVREFTWDRTAGTFRAHYRRIARRTLTQQDIDLLAAAAPL